MRLPRQFVRSQMITFAMGRCCSLMGVSRLVVKLRGTVVWTLRHGVTLSSVGCSLAASRSNRLSAHPSAIYRKHGAGDVVAGG
jgi:hypothetical protein